MDIEQSVDTTELNNEAVAPQQQESTPDVYDGKEKLSERVARESPAKTAQELLDLEKLEKFKFGGKEVTAAELKKQLMLQQDYTKKTQAIAEEKKQAERFEKNLKYDLATVRENPQMADEFRKIYPEKFHHLLDLLAKQAPTAVPSEKVPAAEDKDARFAEFERRMEEKYGSKLARLDQIEAKEREATQRAVNEKVNSTFDRLQAKYNLPPAYENYVIGQLMSDLEQFRQENPGEPVPEFDEKAVEKRFADMAKSYETDIQGHQKRIFEKQKQANVSGRGPAAGGAVPTKGPVQPRTIKEASALAIAALQDT